MLVNKTLSIRRTAANPIVLVLVAAVLISALVSSAKYVGIIGDGGQEYQSLVTTLLFAALFFVVVNIPAQRRFAQRAVFTAIVAGGIVSLYALLQFAGAHIIPAVSSATFNLIGSTVTWACMPPLSRSWRRPRFLSDDEGKYALARRIAVGVAGGLALIVVAVIIFGRSGRNCRRLLVILISPLSGRRPSALELAGDPDDRARHHRAVSAVNISLPIRAPAEVFPSLSQSFLVARDSLFAHPIFGSGPGLSAPTSLCTARLTSTKAPCGMCNSIAAPHTSPPSPEPWVLPDWSLGSRFW